MREIIEEMSFVIIFGAIFMFVSYLIGMILGESTDHVLLIFVMAFTLLNFYYIHEGRK